MAVFVIDASVTLPWCFSDEATEATNALLTRLKTGDEAIVPANGRMGANGDSLNCANYFWRVRKSG